MPENGIRSNWSQCPFQILMKDSDGDISSGTAFLYEANSQSFLITNWHNVSGKNPYTGAYLTGCRRPTSISAKVSTWNSQEKLSFGIAPFEINLYSPDFQTPIWFEHPALGHKCDIVAIPWQPPASKPQFMHNYANRISSVKIPVKPGCPVFIIGFPASLSVGFGLPLWKSGYIASEPHYNVKLGGNLSEHGGQTGGDEIPAFFIDSLTRSGMSGSPVFASYTGNWDMSNPYEAIDPTSPNFLERDDIALGENRMQFVGIYSGRVPTKEGEAALGLCWKIEAIEEICLTRKFGGNPHA